MLFRERCQAQNLVGERGAIELALRRLYHAVPVRSTVRRLMAGSAIPRDRLGSPSRFHPGDWVRVLDEPHILATLDDQDALRGLWFAPQQRHACGGVYRVQQVVRRILDDRGRARPVARTVLLEGVDCGGAGGVAGCGRRCPMMFRDEWLELASPPSDADERDRARVIGFARVRSLVEINATLDGDGACEGLVFMPEMAGFAGRRFAVRERLREVFELDRRVAVRRPVYLLDGLHCRGAILGADGPCDRACALLWHGRWLDFTDGAAAC